MKKFFTYFPLLLALAACSKEGMDMNPATEQQTAAVETHTSSAIQVEIEAPVRLGDENITRASLTYDDDKDLMAFKWDNSDCIGVFTNTEPNPTYSTQQKLVQVADASDTDLLRTFKPKDEGFEVDTKKTYLACFPYFADHATDYTNLPVDYTGQRQTQPVDFSNYWNDAADAAYKASQPMASAHLGAYDYLCTGSTTPTENGGIRFKLNRMGAIVRFWLEIKATENYVYEEIQVVSPSKPFITKATMNALDMAFTPTETSHVVTLKLGAEGEGFDMTEQTNDGTKSTTPFYDWYNGTYTGYLMCYMMFAPVDLKGTSETPTESGYVEKCYIYLVAHEKTNPAAKHYYKSAPLSKPKLQKNTFYQWTIRPNDDEPITFTGISVEEWREGTTFDNGDGTGTGSW